MRLMVSIAGLTRVLMIVLLSALALPAMPAMAAGDAKGEEKKGHKGISKILGTLDWGASHRSVLNIIKAEIDARYTERLDKATDTLGTDRILKEKREAFKKVKSTLVKFTGQRTGYESSIVSTDFKSGQGETMLRVDYDDAQRYYFFKDDALWKIVVAYNQLVSQNTSFKCFLTQVRSKYGSPAGQRTVKGDDKTIWAATWHDEITALVVEDRTGFFGTYVMKFVDKNLAKEDAARAEAVQAPKPPGDDAATDSLVGSIMGAAPEDSEDGDVVDRLTGVETKVDMKTGRPIYEQPVYQPPEDDEPKKKRARKKRRAKKKARKAAPKKKKKADKDSAEPVIIY